MRRPRAGNAPAPAIVAILAASIVACGPSDAPTPDTRLEDAPSQDARMPDADGWITLFDGTDLAAWRGYGRTDVPAAWQVRDGLMTVVPGRDGGDIITRDRFGDFELALDWRVGPAGNSGVFYRAIEGPEAIWHAAPEMQVLDDAGHQDGGSDITSAGALYALYPPTARVVRPAGEWNQARIVARGPHVEHWLNGTKIVEYEASSDDWIARVRRSKFVEQPGFGEARSGHIGLQDHGDTVWFRDIRVRPIAPDGR
ncbi:MAG TPA: DUF1080 domain-containing protein [Longimicrobiales bacterium]|nr:DUF1080 domain-containing protein [Longimicrobiales bacterium]